jgi:hypothetical protein
LNLNLNNQDGSYAVQLTNPDGQRSNLYNFTALMPTPRVDSVDFVGTASNGTVYVSGANFPPGATSLDVFYKDAFIVNLTAAQLQSSTTSFSISFPFNFNSRQPGSYSVVAVNPGNLRSSRVGFIVKQ